MSLSVPLPNICFFIVLVCIFYMVAKIFSINLLNKLVNPAKMDNNIFNPDNGIDLNEQLIKNRPATFFMRVNSSAMMEAGIHKGDVVIVDRSLEAKNGKVIIGVLDGEMM